jgi:anaerobic magnesium-protoporphyrin IX monomethyl ester cyclase
MDFLLVNPPREVPQRADFPPMGLAYIAAYLCSRDIEAEVLDAASFKWKRLEEALLNWRPYIVGLPCWTMERGQTFKAAGLVRKILPKARIIIGGHHASAFPAHMFEQAHADAVVIGEGELTAYDLVRAFLDGTNISDIPGIAYHDGNAVVINQGRPLIEDLDTLPFPCHDRFDLDNYLGLPEVAGKAASMMTSRGCPHKCIYCSGSKFWHRKWRPRSADNVLAEMAWLYNDLGVRNFMFFDDNFTVNKKRAIDICQGIIERGMRIHFVAESHVSHINPELLEWMKKAGCYRIDFGVESGSPKILKTINKKQTAAQIESVFAMVHAAGIKPRAYLMIGNPGEDETTIRETAALMKKIKPYDTQGAHPLVIMPNTHIYEMAKQDGIISDDFWLKSDDMLYYTAEHTEKSLIALRELLMRELAGNSNSKKEYIRYLMKKYYYRYPWLQKLRKFRTLFGKKV